MHAFFYHPYISGTDFSTYLPYLDSYLLISKILFEFQPSNGQFYSSCVMLPNPVFNLCDHSPELPNMKGATFAFQNHVDRPSSKTMVKMHIRIQGLGPGLGSMIHLLTWMILAKSFSVPRSEFPCLLNEGIRIFSYTWSKSQIKLKKAIVCHERVCMHVCVSLHVNMWLCVREGGEWFLA